MKKIMYVPGDSTCIWDIRTEELINLSNDFLKKLDIEIGLSDWLRKYDVKYREWLNDENRDVYNIFDDVNSSIIKKLDSFNERNAEKLYYWFDVDRVEYPEFNWERCPLSNTALVDLGEDVFRTNRLASHKHALIFPIS